MGDQPLRSMHPADEELVAVVAIRNQTDEERAASAIYRANGQCGEMGFPIERDGKRWRAFCNRALGHAEAHGRADKNGGVVEW